MSMKKIVNKIINESVKDADIYYSNGSTWIIFTDNKQWVIELTENKTLWYNYNFFKNAFVYVSMDVVENQHYITKWVEDNIINGGGVKETSHNVMLFQSMMVEDTIQNGVKETKYNQSHQEPKFKDVLENGVKETIISSMVNIGENQVYTSMSNTVGLPVAICGKMILNGSLNIKGVQIPVMKEVYEPILNELETFGIKFIEKYI